MEKIFEDIKFKYSFRDYQKEALDMLEKYKNDDKIHIVAAPGAGKTILALELLIRIGNKALILSPTIAVKEQWIERLKKDFENGDKENLISTDLENPSIVTVITYQALYSLNRKKINIEKIIKQNNIKTIILDEAHHLRKVWFKTLEKIIENLNDCTTIALTATPPYDNGNDFANYMSLCGNIDAKITIPQLVKSKCLCAHQDYIYFNVPTENQNNRLKEFQINVENLLKEIIKNENFIKAIALNDYIVNPEENVNNILDEFDLYISMLSFLKEAHCQYSLNHYNRNIEVPKFNKELMQVILEKYIFGKNILEQEIFKETFKEIKSKLQKLGCIDEKTINLKYNKELSNILLKNSGKLDSITEIIELENEALKEKLKLVVITDFIKDEFYDTEDETEINEIGVMPIFRKIISSNVSSKVAVLTGTMIIIPADLKQELLDIAEKEYGINNKGITVTELGVDFNYAKVVIEEKYKRYTVNLITKLFQKTDISVLVGTVALIGEGWDAPFVNSLIMASFVSSYVTSNQVRGRAIRIDKTNLEKVSNIWHLVCLEKENKKYILGQDYDILSKRFLAYEGLNTTNLKINSGIERLNIENRKYTEDEIEQLNSSIKLEAINREKVTASWNKALEEYVPICREIIPVEKIYKNKSGRTIRKKFVRKICKATYLSMLQTNKISEKARYYTSTWGKNIEFGLRKADTYEQMQFINAVKQAISLEQNSRYIIKCGRFVCSVPENFSKNKKDATIFYKNLKYLGIKSLIYTKSEIGKKLLLKYKMKQFKKKFL